MIQVAGVYENGQITLLDPIPQKKAKVIVTVVEEQDTDETQAYPEVPSKRIPGLNKGPYFMSDDFDAPRIARRGSSSGGP